MLACGNRVSVDVRLPMPQSDPVMDMAKRRASKHSTSRSGDVSFVVPEREGLQLHRSRNLFQLVSLLSVAAIGATIGWFLTDDRPDIAALVGGVLGMILGTFLSGFILMLMPAPTIKITAHEFGRKHRAWKRHLMVTSIAFAVFLFGLPFIISRFGHDDSDLAWVVCLMWMALTVGLCTYTKGLALRIRDCKCPACGATFGRIGSHCSQCGLSTVPEGGKAIEQLREPEPPSGSN